MLFLKRCSDVFDQRREQVIAQEVAAGKTEVEAKESAELKRWYGQSFYVPPSSRWEHLVNEAHVDVGGFLNRALGGLESNNSSLVEVLEHIDFSRKVGQSKIPDLKLRQLISHFSIYRLRNEDFEFPDLLGAAYEYLIGEFADSAGKKGGEFYTPRSVVRMMVRLIKPEQQHSIYDPGAPSFVGLRNDLLHSFSAALEPAGVLGRFQVRGIVAGFWDDAKYEFMTLMARGAKGVVDAWRTSILTALDDSESKDNPLDHKLDFLSPVQFEQGLMG